MTDDKTKRMVNVEQFISAEQLSEDLQFSPVNLSDAMMTQASQFAYYAGVNAKAQHQVDRFKLKVEVLEAKLDKSIRDTAADEGKKTTDKSIMAEIKRNPAYVMIVKALNESKMVAALAKEGLEAWRHRKDMLIQLGAAQREEQKGELRMNIGAAMSENSAALKERVNKRTITPS